MPRIAQALELKKGDREELELISREHSREHREVQRAKVILLASEGISNTQISSQLGVHRNQVILWRSRYQEEGLSGLQDRQRPGRPTSIGEDDVQKVIRTVCCAPPKYVSRWTVRSLAKELKISKSEIHRILQFCDLHPHRLRTFNFSPDPQFEEKLLEVVGLYMNPPENAVVLCVDEKTGIQALDRTQPVLPLKAGKPRSWSNEYVRHGTRTLLASLDVQSGQVTAWVNKTRKAEDFIKFMNKVVKAYPNQRLCVVLDNLNIHCGNLIKQWLKEHPRVSFHYTPTHASWVNMIEGFFSILTTRGLQQSVHKSGKQLSEFLYRFIGEYNKQCGPFVWTKGPQKLKRIIQMTKSFQGEKSYAY